MTQILTYKDRNYPKGDLSVEVRGDFLRIEYSPDGYYVDAIYVPMEPLFFALRKEYGFDL